MVRRLLLLLAAALVVGAGSAWVLSAPRPAFAEGDAALFEGGDAGRGQDVFRAGLCASCHASPGQSDRLRLGGGMALSAPVGTLYPPNISMDATDGIGRWRGLDLANALMSGVSPDGRHYYPALPYPNYAHMRTEDVRDLMAYLRTLPPVPGRAPPHRIPFPLSIRRSIGLWKLLFLDRSPIVEDPSRDAAWNRGRYLVEALTHCTECHTVRNVLGAVKPSAAYAGAPDLEGTGFVPNITPRALGRWSEADWVTSLTTGETPDRRLMGSSMADVVHNTAGLPEADRRAIAAYLRTVRARHTPGT